MARKPVLEGGKKDEIIAAAAQLFFTEGFEQTSVRKILDQVNGEVGMFYHYFRSKEELFDVVADRFFRQYEKDFSAMCSDIRTPEEFVTKFLSMYKAAMAKYARIKTNMHWTIRSAMHERTVASLIPVAQDLLKKFGYSGSYPADIAAARTVASLSAAIHSESFQTMNDAEKKDLLICLIKDTLSA